MTILKQAKTMTIQVKEEYHLQVGGELEKIASKINIEATGKNLVLISNKKIVSHGNK